MENEKVKEAAEGIKEITTKLNIPFIFKSSYYKANHSSIHSFRGPGLDEGLEILAKIKEEFDVLLTSDIHEPNHAGKVLDVIQVRHFYVDKQIY